ncbi:N-alpha-acetyltransferase 38, NatC auxiliary subunit-like [Stomoxys calcitrans]|uniref:Sm domain-containing protein n=1 Tax=Stomoxys calcitrans TaxID=35570 RepID=A0A1I8Q3N6_STOCA|nr:N-alpha-acetyltransferase 38, NatC auxiliary subunit-like [Stomoxys calcitrans]
MNDLTNPKQYENPLLNNVITNNSNISDEHLSPGKRNLRNWLGKPFRIVITDGRVLVGFFNCTDKDSNIVLSMCAEYLEEGQDARILGNVMIPGKHIVSVSVDMPAQAVLLGLPQRHR